MQRIKILGLALVAVLAFGAVASEAASAAAPEFTVFPNTITEIKSGASTFEIKGELGAITCEKDEKGGKTEITSAKLGKFDLLLLGCKESLGNKCTGLTDKTAGSILVTGEFHVRYITKEPKDVAIIFLLNELHFECGSFVLVTVKGCAAGLVTPINTKTTKFTVTLTQKEGKQGVTEVFNEEGTKLETCILLGSKNGGEFKQSGQGSTEELVTEKTDEIKA